MHRPKAPGSLVKQHKHRQHRLKAPGSLSDDTVIDSTASKAPGSLDHRKTFLLTSLCGLRLP